MCVPPFTHTHTHTNDLHKQVQQSQCMTSVLQWHTEKTWRKNWEINNRIERSIQNRWTMKNSMNTQWSECVNPITTFTFSRRFYPKQLTYVRLTMYTHFTFTLMAHCTSGAIRSSVLLKDAPTGNRTSNLLITNRLLYLLYHCRPTQHSDVQI